MNAAVSNKVLEGDAGGLATDRIEARKHNGLGRIIDDQVDAGNLLEGTDVATLAADDATLEVIGRNVHGGNGNLGGVVGGTALNSQRQDFLSGLVALGANLLLGLANDRGGLMGNLATNLVEELLVSVLAGQVGDTLELRGLLSAELLKLAGALLDLASLAGQLVLTLVEGIVAAIEGLLALHHTVLERTNLVLALLVLGLGSLLVLDDLLFSLEQSLFFEGLSLALCIAD